MLLKKTYIAAAKHYDNLENSASQVGLRANNDKTKSMHINNHREVAPSKALEGLKVLKDFKCLNLQTYW